MPTVTFLISLKTWANVPNLQERLGYLLDEAIGDGVRDIDGMQVTLCPDYVSDVVVTLVPQP
jgi:Na+/H+-translocating membrane pyrophosphatase